ncbi:hypothetical protein B0T22DRAFT_453162 [Podospora appendiculata]|uniref:BHLH domain-containing protein n=1 Tax=Podospora appendiculata TaxID=314037 RepID=A0AAE1CHC1_9PEZI|nr:hypothetical protein B0T22DRAFT_453162 [Podospora appendiculata]
MPGSPPSESGSGTRDNSLDADLPPKLRLTEQEKKANHIASEKKRRQGIRDGFDRLANMVPGLEGQGRSEGIVLQGTYDYTLEQLRKRRDLIEKLDRLGVPVPQEHRDLLHDFENSGNGASRSNEWLNRERKNDKDSNREAEEDNEEEEEEEDGEPEEEGSESKTDDGQEVTARNN